MRLNITILSSMLFCTPATAQVVKGVEVHPPIRICDGDEPELHIVGDDFKCTGWESNNIWTVSLTNLNDVEFAYGWIDANSPNLVVYNLTTHDGDQIETDAIFNDLTEIVDFTTTTTTDNGPTSTTTQSATYDWIRNLINGYIIEQCEQNVVVASEGGQEAGPLLTIGAIVAGVAYTSKVTACIRDTNQQWRDGLAACMGDASCEACCNDRAAEDRGNCLSLNGPDDDYDHCLDNPPPSNGGTQFPHVLGAPGCPDPDNCDIH